jgi:hypothetical protein
MKIWISQDCIVRDDKEGLEGIVDYKRQHEGPSGDENVCIVTVSMSLP